MQGFRTSARRGTWGAALVLVVLVATSGCQSSAPKRTVVAEPGLTDPGATVVEAGPLGGSQVSWVDRHPLFYKPREYYDKTGNNTVVKAAAATILGIPAGIFGEFRQIVTGSPNGAKY